MTEEEIENERMIIVTIAITLVLIAVGYLLYDKTKQKWSNDTKSSLPITNQKIIDSQMKPMSDAIKSGKL